MTKEKKTTNKTTKKATTKLATKSIKKAEKKIASPNQGSLPRWIYSSLTALPNDKLVGEKQKKKWIYLNSEHFAQKIKILALTLKKLGVKKGEKVGIVGEVGISWVIFDQAVMSCGAISVSLFEDLGDHHFNAQIKHAKVKMLLVSGKKGYQKCVQNAENIEKVIVDEHYTPPKSQKIWKRNQIISFDSTTPIKKKNSEREEREWQKMLSQLQLDQIASIVYTNGTTGSPKAITLTHRCFIHQIKQLTKCFRIFGERDRCVSFLSLAHTFERMVVYFYLSRGVSVSFCQKEEELEHTLQQVQPTMMSVMPRILQDIYEKIEKNIENETGAKKWLMHLALSQALRTQPSDSLMTRFHDYCLYKKIRKNMGGELRFIISTATALRQREYLFFTNVGLPIFEGYTMTETSSFVTINHPNANKNGSVGQPLDGVKIKINNKGKLLIKSDSLMKGYCGKITKNHHTIDKNGWIDTEEIAKIDKKGFMTIIGRSKEAIKTLTEKSIYPNILELELTKNRFIQHCLITADPQKNLHALIFIDPCDSQQLSKIKSSIRKTIETVNGKRDYLEHIKHYDLIEKKLSIKDDELTPKMNLKRNEILKKYAKNIAKN